MPSLQAFPRSERLKKSSEFREVFEDGRRVAARGFVCYVVQREGRGRKFGVAVSRKVGGAVVRNRVKRYLREIYRRSRSELKDGATIVIVARPEASTMSYGECENALGRLFRSGGAIGG